MAKIKRYAVAYKRFENDDSVSFKGNAVCLFGQDEYCVERFKEHYIAYIPEKKDAFSTYRALEKAISTVVGKDVEIVFTNYEPTVWRIKV